MQLVGRVAVVTGAAVGIGRAIAIAFGKEGAKVAVNYSQSRQEADETCELVAQVGGDAFPVQADVANDFQVRRMVTKTADRFGRIDVMVNNAGVTTSVCFSDLEGLTEAIWDRVFGVNLKGTFFCCRAVIPIMRTQGEGSIINIASISGIWPQGSSLAYSASKAGVIHLSKCLARTLGPEIRVNAIAPGFIADTRWGRPDPEAMSKAAHEAPLKRVGMPDDVARAALFLATGGDFMTGEVLVVDGGMVLR
jgi:3-oxoacyl-[acyl-carrier protein] reductase